MGFADLSLSNGLQQMSGSAHGLKMEAGCFSGASTMMAVPTRLTHVVGGLMFGCLTGTGSAGRPIIGSVCEGGVVEFTCNYAAANTPASYFVAGW